MIVGEGYRWGDAGRVRSGRKTGWVRGDSVLTQPRSSGRSGHTCQRLGEAIRLTREVQPGPVCGPARSAAMLLVVTRNGSPEYSYEGLSTGSTHG